MNDTFESSIDIDDTLDLYGVRESGDFTSRMSRLISSILQEISALEKKGKPVTPQILTNIIFKGGSSRLKELIIDKSDVNVNIVFLFDNIDKGWPASGVDAFDVRLVRLLVEALEKIRRDFSAAGRDFVSVVFLRNDIYELMVGETPDRGKSGQVVIDWTDRAKLRQVIFERIKASTGDKNATFDQLWSRFVCEEINGKPSFEYLVDHCLMRPRFLINIVE